jgi:8-oxo-dGTP pyrophosphatase MutT (NUDIX family)
MDADRPAPGEELNPGAPTVPRQAATVIVMRGADDGLEVLLVKRNPDALVKFSRWITPRQVKIRFDTHFFLAALPEGETPEADGGEVVDARWYAPADALVAWRAGEIELVFPTIKHLEQLQPFASADALLDWARGRRVEPVEPQVVLEGEVARVVLPGEPGYQG